MSSCQDLGHTLHLAPQMVQISCFFAFAIQHGPGAVPDACTPPVYFVSRLGKHVSSCYGDEVNAPNSPFVFFLSKALPNVGPDCW